MIARTCIAAALAVSAGMAAGETVTSGELSENRSGYPCFVTLNTDAGKTVTLQLSDYKDVWSLRFVIADRASIYRRYFDNSGLRDEDAFEEAFGRVRIGERDFEFNDVSLFEVQREEVDEKSAGFFGIEERHNVVRALEAMSGDGIAIQGLVALDGTVDAVRAFRSCAYSAMGLHEGARVETDYRAEYRMIFEKSFENWVTSMTRAEHCLVGRFDDDAVAEVIDAAADAFYPGILNLRKRSAYREDLEGMLPLARLAGMAEARTSGCSMAGRLADVSRIPVDRAIESAEDVD